MQNILHSDRLDQNPWIRPSQMQNRLDLIGQVRLAYAPPLHLAVDLRQRSPFDYQALQF
jgi:hypothetical protein